MLAEDVDVELNALDPGLRVAVGAFPVGGDEVAGLGVDRAYPAVELGVAEVPDLAVDLGRVLDTGLALDLLAKLYIVVGILDRVVLLEVDAGLLEVIPARQIGRLRDQGEGHVVNLIGVGKAAVLPLDQREQPFHAAARGGIPVIGDEVVHRTHETTQLPRPTGDRVEHRRLDPALEVGAVLGADDVTVAVPAHVDLGAGLLLEGLDDRFAELAHQLVLHPDHVPVVDGHPFEIGLGLGEHEIRGQRGGNPRRSKHRRLA